MSANWIPMIVKGDGNRELPNRIINTMICASVGVLAYDDAPLHKTFSSVRTVLDDEQKAWIDTMLKAGWFDRWYALDTAEKEWQFCKDILKEVFKMPDSEVDQMADQKGQPDDGGGDESDGGGEAEADDDDTGGEHLGVGLRVGAGVSGRLGGSHRETLAPRPHDAVPFSGSRDAVRDGT